MTKDPEDRQIEILNQKITKFNRLMEEISHEFSDIILLGKEDKFHDLVIEMVKSLDTAQKMVKKVYYIFKRRNDSKENLPMTSEHDAENFSNLKAKLKEYTLFMEGLSEELNTKFFEGKYAEFQEAVEDMIDSLDKTREAMKKAYFQVNFGEGRREPKGSGGGP
jgi:flagellar hook-basal body complex protein FliE